MVTSNAKNLIKQLLSSGETKGLLEAKDVGGTTRYIADLTSYPAVVEDSFTLTAADAGISVGSGSTAAADTDYQLETPITSGLTGRVVATSAVDSNGNAYIVFSLALENTTGSNITISEIGYKQEISASDSSEGTTATDRVFLLDRTVFDTVTIAGGGQAVIDYKIKSAISNSGGVVGSKTITQNGTYNALDDDLDGYSSVTVNITPALGTKTITQNGTYNASDDSLDGYSSVTINVSGGGGGEVLPPSDIVPVLSAADATVVSASSTYGGYPAWYAVDGNDNTYWCSSAAGTSTEWLKLKLLRDTVITAIYIHFYAGDGTVRMYDDDSGDELEFYRNGSWFIFKDLAITVRTIRIEMASTGNWKGIYSLKMYGM